MMKEGKQRPGEEQGWTEIWQAQDTKWDTAINQIYGLRKQPHYTCPSDSVLVLQGTLTGDDLRSAPQAIRRVFNDLGVTLEDRVSIGLSVPPGRDFVFEIRPEQITDDKIGLRLSPSVGQGAVIAPLHQSTGAPIEVYPFKPAYISSRDRLMKRASDLHRTYKHISGSVERIGLYYGRRHPYMVDIVDSIATWATSLVAARKISIQHLSPSPLT